MGACQSRSAPRPEAAVVPAEEDLDEKASFAEPHDGATSQLPARAPVVESDLDFGSLVKIWTVEATVNYALPWQVEEQLEFTGSGFAIEGRRIVTNAHVISQAVSVRVRREGDAQKFEARVHAVCPEMDLAVLTVADEAFGTTATTETARARGSGALPRIGEATTVIGYPTGGEQVSVTKGVVSRIDMQRYTGYANVEPLLVVQIDAAINAGNSGGPVFDVRGDVIGVAFCKDATDDSDNIGYLIPAPIVGLFFGAVAMREAAGGDAPFVVPGVAGLGVATQPAENAHLRRHCRMAPGTTGVVVTRVAPLSPLHGKAKTGDVILAIDGVEVSNDGSVPLPDDAPPNAGKRRRRPRRVDYDHLVTSRPVGSRVIVKLHDATTGEVRTRRALAPCRGSCPASTASTRGRPTSSSAGWSSRRCPCPSWTSWTRRPTTTTTLAIRHACANAEKRDPDQQIVVLQRILVAPECNDGYDDAHHAPSILESVDGRPWTTSGRSRTASTAAGDFVRFVFRSGHIIALDRRLCLKHDPDTLAMNAIPSRCSADLEDPERPSAAWCGSLFLRAMRS
ncbi:serine-type endopeptidase [Aureococcus anophagefferens]|nr:serine-type endopeptidase [Aureococcus anophagefferens]